MLKKIFVAGLCLDLFAVTISVVFGVSLAFAETAHETDAQDDVTRVYYSTCKGLHEDWQVNRVRDAAVRFNRPDQCHYRENNCLYRVDLTQGPETPPQIISCLVRQSEPS